MYTVYTYTVCTYTSLKRSNFQPCILQSERNFSLNMSSSFDRNCFGYRYSVMLVGSKSRNDVGA